MTFLNVSTQAVSTNGGCQDRMHTNAVYCNMNAHFPWKVHAMLTESEAFGIDLIVSWLPDGHSFKVHDHYSFVRLVLPKFFKQTKYKSFQRQLNLWGYTRVPDGDRKGAYFHPWLVRGESKFCARIKRQPIRTVTPEKEKRKMSCQPKGKVRQPKCNKNIQSHQTIKKRTDEENDQSVERSSFPKSFSKLFSDENNTCTASTHCAVGFTTPTDTSISYEEMSISFFEDDTYYEEMSISFFEGRQFYSVEDDN